MIVSDVKRAYAHMQRLASGMDAFVDPCDFEEDWSAWMTIADGVMYVRVNIYERDLPKDRVVFIMYNATGQNKQFTISLKDFLSMTVDDFTLLVDNVRLQRLEYQRLSDEMSAFRKGLTPMMKSTIAGLIAQKEAA